MLALIVTLLFALFVLGPDLCARILLGFIVPRRSQNLTKGEEVTRALLWSFSTVIPALLWGHFWGGLDGTYSRADLKTCFAGLYSEGYFKDHQAAWFTSIQQSAWLVFALLWRTYVVTLVFVSTLVLATRNYSLLRRKLGFSTKLKSLLAAMVLPRVAPWHLLLSRMLLEDAEVNIHVDVMTKANALYQGRYADKVLSSDGTLLSITLADPQRFRREEYMHYKLQGGTPPKPSEFWKPIPTNMFVIIGSEVQTINLRYVPSKVAALRRKDSVGDLEEVLNALSIAVSAAKAAKGSRSLRKDGRAGNR